MIVILATYDTVLPGSMEEDGKLEHRLVKNKTPRHIIRLVLAVTAHCTETRMAAADSLRQRRNRDEDFLLHASAPHQSPPRPQARGCNHTRSDYWKRRGDKEKRKKARKQAYF